LKYKPYPITVKPILKEQVWGGNAISAYVRLPKGKHIGEAWFMADQQGNASVISNGAYRGMPLDVFMAKYGQLALGKKIALKYGKRFPLLFKFIDSRDKLSVQVHPDDATARKKENKPGKAEAWYVIKSGIGSYVYAGFSKRMPGKQQIIEAAENGSIHKYLKKYGTKGGDAFFVPPGTVHSIGPGNLIFEIQQNSDITYRLYDWGRKNLGVQRELHVLSAADAVRDVTAAGKCHCRKEKYGNIRVKTLVKSVWFDAYEIKARKKSEIRKGCRPCVIAVIKGRVKASAGGSSHFFKRGSVVLMPAADYAIRAAKDAKIILVDIK